MSKQKMPFQDAMDLVPDDLPDGAYFAMAHEIAGLEYGDGFDELVDDTNKVNCPACGKLFGSVRALEQHDAAKHGGS